MLNLYKMLLAAFPSTFVISKKEGFISVRDGAQDKGRGYEVKISENSKYLQAEIKFDDFALPLMDYASKMLTQENLQGKKLLDKYRGLEIRRYTLSSTRLFSEVTLSSDWWLTIEYKKEIGGKSDDFVFIDLLIFWILNIFPYQVDGELEGFSKEYTSVKYERSVINRSICLAFHGYACKACGINMSEKYHIINREFIHVHHIEPISNSGIRRFDPIKDLIPLCPNCHNVAHLKNPPYTVEEIRDMLKNNGLHAQ